MQVPAARASFLAAPPPPPAEPLTPPSPFSPRWKPGAQGRPPPSAAGSQPEPSIAAAPAKGLPLRVVTDLSPTGIAPEARLALWLARIVTRRTVDAPSRAAPVIRQVLGPLLDLYWQAEVRGQPLCEQALERMLARFLLALEPGWPPRGRPPALTAATHAAVAFLVHRLPELTPAQVRAVFAALARGLGLDRRATDRVQAEYLERLSDELVHAAFDVLDASGVVDPELTLGQAVDAAIRGAHALAGLRDGARPAGPAARSRVDWLSRLLRPACGLAARRQGFSHEAVSLRFLVGAALGAGLAQADWHHAARLPPVAVPRWTLHPDDLPAMLKACEEAREGQACASRDAPGRGVLMLQLDPTHRELLAAVPGFTPPGPAR